MKTQLSLESTLEELTLYEAYLESDRLGVEVAKIFEANPLLPGIVLTEKKKFAGMISRRYFFEHISRPHSLELFQKKPLLTLYKFHQSDIIILEAKITIIEAVRQCLQRPPELIHEPLVIKISPGEYRLLDVHQLLLAQVQIHELTTLLMRDSEAQLRQQAQQLQIALLELQRTQTQLVQTEKMSSLGQLVAGVAHEINNPISFIYGNLPHAENYILGLLRMLNLYQKYYPNPESEIQEEADQIELEYLLEDLPKLLNSMKEGAERIRQLVLSLRNFCRLDEAQMKSVNIHEGLDNTIVMLHKKLKERPGKPEIQVKKFYSELPLVECYPGQLNQVFLNIINNAIDALEENGCQRSRPCHSSPIDPDFSSVNSLGKIPDTPTIYIQTELLNNQCVRIRIIDNGPGMSETVMMHLFDPFFTTKPVGAGTGLGLSISYEIIVNQHGGDLKCFSTLNQGAEFVIDIPLRQFSTTLMVPGLL